MPKLVNRNGHGVRATDSDGKSHRLRPGQVVEADGSAADALSGINGVESASGDDEKAWEAHRGSSGGNSGRGGGISNAVEGAGKARRTALRREQVAVPLNIVVGDDEAPLGPPTGTITTKQEAARNEDAPDGATAFGTFEAQPGDEEKEGTGEVHSRQAEARAELEEATNAVLEDAQEDTAEGSRAAGAARASGKSRSKKSGDKPAAKE